MRILRAVEMGMCFGVRDALQLAASVKIPNEVTIHGELVHNPEVNQQLTARGFRQQPEDRRHQLPETPVVMITAHGISNARTQELQQAGKQLLDTTCPLVRRAHEAAADLQREARHILLIGKRGHVEVSGIVEDLASCTVIENLNDVATFAAPRLGVLCQTTTPPDQAEIILAEIHRQNPGSDIRFIDTVCHPTKLRQEAVRRLLPRVSAMVVVGGVNSNNTRQLVQLCNAANVPAWQVTSAEELQPAWFQNITTVGLTAGTSTPDTTIQAVYDALMNL